MLIVSNHKSVNFLANLSDNNRRSKQGSGQKFFLFKRLNRHDEFHKYFISEYSQCNRNRPIHGRCSESRSSKIIGSPPRSDKVPNIMLLGKTGAGKSFFANGIIGEKDPAQGKI